MQTLDTDISKTFATQPSPSERNVGTLMWKVCVNLMLHAEDYIQEFKQPEKLYMEQCRTLDIQLDALAGTGFLKNEREECTDISTWYIHENTINSSGEPDIASHTKLTFNEPQNIYKEHIIKIPAQYMSAIDFIVFGLVGYSRDATIGEVWEAHKSWLGSIINNDSNLSPDEKWALFLFNTKGKY